MLVPIQVFMAHPFISQGDGKANVIIQVMTLYMQIIEISRRAGFS